MKVLIKNGTVVNTLGEQKADILVDGEKIVAIGTELPEEADRVIDAAGKFVLPGGVDNHAHFAGLNTDGVTTFAEYDTTYINALGGTTTIVDFCPNEPGMNLVDSVNYRLNVRAKGQAAVDVALHANCTDFTDETIGEIPKLVEMGVPSMKLFMAYKGTPLYMDDAKLISCMKAAKECGMTMMVHAENPDVLDLWRNEKGDNGYLAPKYHYMTRPTFGEAEAVSRAIYFSKATGCPLCIVHVSCKDAVDVIRDAKEEGVPVMAETCPHHLTLDRHLMDNPDFDVACRWVCSPPLRDEAERSYLWRALNQGWLDVCGSDHAGIPLYQKHWGEKDFRKIPNGCPGSGDRLNVLWTYGVAAGKITRQKLIDIYATTPAKMNGLYPRKGTIEVGADADIVVFDPDYRGVFSVETNPTGVEYNIFEGMEQIGRPETVLLRGKVVVEDAKYVGKPGDGQFVPGKPYGSAYDILKY